MRFPSPWTWWDVFPFFFQMLDVIVQMGGQRGRLMIGEAIGESALPPL
jgi:hypothetical protein